MTAFQPISESELKIMEIIWKNAGKTMFAPLMEELGQQSIQWKPNTVLTFLTRLAEKGMVQVEKQGRLNVYSALLSEEAYLENVTQTFVHKVYGGDAKGLVASLLRQECLHKKDIDELQHFWEEAKQK